MVLGADGCIWWRPAIVAGFPWSLIYAANPGGPERRLTTSEHVPQRPLVLLVRNGQPAVDLDLRSRLTVLADDLAVDTIHYDLYDVEVRIRELLRLEE